MKKLLVFPLVLIILLSGCNKQSAIESLSGNDKLAYQQALAVCNSARYPKSVEVVSGFVDETGATLRVLADNDIGASFLDCLVSFEDGMWVANSYPELADKYAELYDCAPNFNPDTVNAALAEYWKK